MFHPLITNFFRLKVLKDEIKKPYFIALKKFLWEEGVRGPDDIPKSLKVFPSRERASELSVAIVKSIIEFQRTTSTHGQTCPLARLRL
jgi:hypothetical protein